MKPGILRAGAAAVDITPPLGTQIAGNIGVPRPAEDIAEHIYAKALVLDDGRTRLCVLSTDVLAIRGDYADAARRRAQERLGIERSHVMLHCTQNHHAPSVGHCFCLDEPFWRRYVPPNLEWVLGGEPEFNERFLDGVARAAEQAAANLQPVTLSAGRAIEGRIAFNRRAILRDGTAVMHPPQCDPRILQVEGPVDPEVSMLVLTGNSGQRVAALMHFSCHPDHQVPSRTIAGGWPGAWCEGMREPLGPGAVPMVMNGCCGNLHPRNPIVEGRADHREMGRVLSEDGRKILAGLEEVQMPDRPLDFRSKTIRIPLRELDSAKVAAARRTLEEHPDPIWHDAAKTGVSWDWIYAVSMVDLAAYRERQPWYDYEVQAFRIGDMALVALTGEPFVEGQLEIKLKSPASYTMIAHMSNGYVGYVPTPAAILRGGFETRAAHWSKLVPEALELIANEALTQLREMFA